MAYHDLPPAGPAPTPPPAPPRRTVVYDGSQTAADAVLILANAMRRKHPHAADLLDGVYQELEKLE